VPANDVGYAYDAIGNRETWTQGDGPTYDMEATYDANALNQYTGSVIDRGTGQDVEQRFIYDEDGNLTDQYIAGDTDCDGDVDFDDITAFYVALNGRLAYEAAYPYCEWLSADVDGDGDVDLDDFNPFYSLLGNGGGMSWHYTWDAENRLIGVEPLAEPMEGFQKVSFGYDVMGRGGLPGVRRLMVEVGELGENE